MLSKYLSLISVCILQNKKNMNNVKFAGQSNSTRLHTNKHIHKDAHILYVDIYFFLSVSIAQ